MIKKFGKPVDIVKFKSSMLNIKTLQSLIEENRRTGQFVSNNLKCKKIYNCPVCDSKDKRLVQTIYDIAYNVCNQCNMLYVNVQLEQNELKEYYTESKDSSNLIYSDKKTYQYRVKEVSSPKIEFISGFITTQKKRWLDVGSGIGDVVYNLREKGFDALGLEVNEESIKFSKEVFGLNLERKTLSDILAEKGSESFDIISYIGVLEHIPNPLEQISCALEVLTPGGLLVLDVPNAQSFSVMTDIFFHDSVVRHMTPTLHIMLFSQKSLLTLAQKYNLKAEAMWFIGLDFYNLILHLGVHIPGFMESSVCQKLLDFNNEIQATFDAKEMSDQILFIARK